MSDEHSQPVSSSFSLLSVLGDDGSYNYPNLADPHFCVQKSKKWKSLIRILIFNPLKCLFHPAKTAVLLWQHTTTTVSFKCKIQQKLNNIQFNKALT